MKYIKTNLYLTFAITIISVILLPGLAKAAQPEFSVSCDEGVISEPIGMTYGDSTAGCEISPATDSDRFSFDGTPGELIRINVLSTTTNMDPLLEVRDPLGTVIDTASCSGFGCSFTLGMTLAKSGTYFLTLSDSGTNEAGHYIMQLERILPAPDLVRLDYDLSVLDSVNPATDVDHYHFNATAGTSIRFNALSTTTNLDPTLEVRDPNGTLVLNGVIDGASCSGFGCSFSVDFTPLLSGTYSVLFYDEGTNEGGGYQLSLWCVVGPCDSDGDGDPDLAAPVISYVTPVTDSISPAVDGDIFTFNGTAGTSIRFNALSTTTNLDPTLEVRDPNGTLVLNGAVDGASCSGFGCSVSVDLLPAMSGTYSVLLYDEGTNEGGGYQLSLWCLLGECDSDADGIIDGDQQIVSYGETVSDKIIEPAVDADSYIFRGTVGDQIRISVLSTTTNMDPTIEVYDPNGTRILNGAPDGAACSGFGCSFSIDLSPILSGAYRVLFYDGGTNENGGYNFSLQCLFSPGGNCANLTPPACGDNCSNTPNPNQIDTDGDGFGNICDADFDGNGAVNFADLAIMKSVFFTANSDADLNSDGGVNFGDLAILKSMFFGPPGPSCAFPNSP